MIIGIIGMLLILFSWIFEMIETAKRHERLIDLRFAFLYFGGVIALILYSIQISDVVFLLLNIFLLIFIAGEIVASMFLIKRRGRVS